MHEEIEFNLDWENEKAAYFSPRSPDNFYFVAHGIYKNIMGASEKCIKQQLAKNGIAQLKIELEKKTDREHRTWIQNFISHLRSEYLEQPSLKRAKTELDVARTPSPEHQAVMSDSDSREISENKKIPMTALQNKRANVEALIAGKFNFFVPTTSNQPTLCATTASPSRSDPLINNLEQSMIAPAFRQ
jgi:hypothetical protein